MRKYSKKSVRPLLQKKCLELFVSTHEALSPPGLCATQLATFLSNSTLTLIIQARSYLPNALFVDGLFRKNQVSYDKPRQHIKK